MDNSRRKFLKSSAGLIAGASALQISPEPARAQGDALLARVQRQPRILLKGGLVLTQDRQIGDFEKADLLIENGKIREIRPDISAADAAVVDATNHIVIPGLINSHHHCYQGILRAVLPDGLFPRDYAPLVIERLTPAFEPDDVYISTLMSAIGMIEIGTTGTVDTSQVSHTPEHSDAGIKALQDSGIRAVYALSRGAGGRGSDPASRYPQDIVRLQKTYFNTSDQLLSVALGGTLDPTSFSYARQVGVRMVSHGANNRREQVLRALADANLLRPGDEYLHCTQLSDASWKLIKDSGGVVSLSPPIEMTMGHGMPGIERALANGVRPSLSADSDVSMAQDLFSIMRSTFTLQRLLVLQRAEKGEKNLAPLLTSREVLEFATIEGARCCNFENKAGSLTPGKDADIVMLSTDHMSLWPLNNAPGAIVTLMTPANVDTVFIAGKVKKWRGNLVGFDLARIRERAQTARDNLFRRASYNPGHL